MAWVVPLINIYNMSTNNWTSNNHLTNTDCEWKSVTHGRTDGQTKRTHGQPGVAWRSLASPQASLRVPRCGLMDQWMFISHNQIHTLFPDTFFFHSYFQIYVVWLMDILIFYILLYYHSWAISTFRFLNVFFPPAAHYNNIHYPDCHSPPPLPYLVLNSNIKYFNEFNFDTALIWKKKNIYIYIYSLHMIA